MACDELVSIGAKNLSILYYEFVILVFTRGVNILFLTGGVAGLQSMMRQFQQGNTHPGKRGGGSQS